MSLFEWLSCGRSWVNEHTALRNKSKDWLARNQNNVSEWSDMSTRGLLFQWASTIKITIVKPHFWGWSGNSMQTTLHSAMHANIIYKRWFLYVMFVSWKIVSISYDKLSLLIYNFLPVNNHNRIQVHCTGIYQISNINFYSDL
jgi:hypothetical protein